MQIYIFVIHFLPRTLLVSLENSGYLSNSTKMKQISLLLYIICRAYAVDPCITAPLSAVSAAPFSLAGWIPDYGDTLNEVSTALGIEGSDIILSLNPDIFNPNSIFAGLIYCVPYTS